MPPIRLFIPALCALALSLLSSAGVAAAAAPICAPASCAAQGQSRSIVLTRSAAAKKAAKVSRSTGRNTALRVSVKFAPKGSRPHVTVTGPGGFKRVISKSTSFRKVRPGRYVIVADAIPGTEITTFASYHRTRAKLRKGLAGWVGVRYTQRVASGTLVARPSAIEAVSGDPAGVRDIVVDDPQALVKPGTVLASGVGPQTPSGMLVAVASVTRSGEKTIARGAPAPLTAIGPQAEIEASPKLSMTKAEFAKAASAGAASRTFQQAQPGFSLDGKPHAFAAAAKKNKGFGARMGCGAGVNASFDGDVNFDAGADVGLAWGGFWHPLTIAAHVGVNLHQDARMALTVEGSAKCTLDLDLLPEDYRFAPWTFTVGPVPVVIVPKLNFQLTGEASVGARLTTSVEQSLDTSFGVQWDGSRFGPYGKAAASFKTNKPTLSGSASVKAAIGPKLIFDFYDIAGPYLTADLFLQLKADTAKDPWWRLSGGLQAGGGLRFKVWNFDFDKSIPNIWSEDWTIAQADKPPVPGFTTTTLPDADYQKAYSSKVAATTARGPVTYSISSGRLPDGLKLNATTGALTGTVTSFGTREFEVAAKDALGQFGRRTFRILTKTPPAVLSTTALPAATVGTAYDAALAASGAVAPYRWDVTGGALPAGVRLGADGALSGTPTAIGTSTFTVRVRGVDDHEASRQLTLAVDPQPLVIATTSLPAGKADVPYSHTLTARGGRGPYTWSATDIPAGLALAADGTLSGTPTTATTTPLTSTVTDADGRTTSVALAVSILDVDPPVITSAALPQGMSGTPYGETLTAAGGRAPYTWSANSGVPAGLSVSASGHVSGTPSAAGASQLSVTVSDRDGRTGTRTLALTVLPPGMAITTSSLPDGTRNEAYDEALTVLGGTGPYTWSVAAGTLPTGITLNPSTGHVAGTPTVGITANVTIKVVDANSSEATVQLSLYVDATAGNYLLDATCPTANLCMTVDVTGKVYTRTPSAGWTAGVDTTLPLTQPYTSRVSCATETYCLATERTGEVRLYDGTAWTSLPSPGGVTQLFDVDCPTTTFCSAVGLGAPGHNGVWKWDGTTWSGPFGSAMGNGFVRVSCPAADDCAVLGNPQVATFDGSTVTSLPNLPLSGGSALGCTPTGTCFTGWHSGTPAADQFDGTSWSPVAVTDGADTLVIDPVGCARVGTFCAASGYGAVGTPLWTWDGTSWTKGAATDGKTSQIACGSPSFCVTVTSIGASRLWDGTSWGLSRTFARG